MSQDTIESILHEKRLFQPPAEFSQKAHIKSLEEYQAIYDKAKADPQAFLGRTRHPRIRLVPKLGYRARLATAFC